MSAVLPSPPAVEKLDPFRYGWRLVKHVGPDGHERFQEVPLTLEDALHPQEGDHYMVSTAHMRDLRYLADAFEGQLKDVPGATVLCEQRIAWDEPGVYAHGPDVSVVFDVGEQKDWRTFNVMIERTRPALIVEIVSESTRSNDLSKKVQEYADVGVPRYVIVDARETPARRDITLIHYELSGRRKAYVPGPIAADGRVWLPEVELWLGAQDGRVVCYDADGHAIPTRLEVAAERDVAVDERDAAIEARRVAERRAREAEAGKQAAERLAAQRAADIERLESELRKLQGKAD